MSYNAILELLGEQFRICNRLLDISRREQEFLLKGDIEGLEHVVSEFNSLMPEIQRLVAGEALQDGIQQEGAAFQAEAGEAGIEEAGVDAVLEEVSTREIESQKIADALADLRQIIDEIARINRANSFLIKDSNDFLIFLHNLMNQGEPGGIYRNPGHI